MEREVRYCTTSDEVRIAYAIRGSGPLVVFCPQFIESFSLMPTYVPTVEAFFQTLEAEWSVVLYDTRGTGMSQREGIERFTPDAQSRDLEAVIEAIGGEAYALIAWTVSTAAALRYVLRRPDTISRLILGNGGARLTDSGTPDGLAAFAALARTNWTVAAQTFADLGPRDDEPEQATLTARWVRDSTTGDIVARILADTLAASDITSVLSTIRTPTLVIHHLENQVTPVSVARALAAALPNARLALLPGRSGWYTQGHALENMQRFLDEGRPQRDAIQRLGDDTIIASPESAPQSFASGRYTVRRMLGEGGQKVVYLVHDTALDRDCALALIRGVDLGPDDLLRFQREAQAMARLGAHSNIVSVFDIGEQDGRPFLVSEYIAGGDLRQLLLKRGRLPLGEALAVGSDIARALAVAHGRGVVHRDVKPPNIWLTEDGAAKLGDFGLAFSLDRSRLTMPGTVMGTAAYLAPEQALGEPVDERSDLYALGCVLYEMVCGRPPFADANATAVIAQHINATPAAPSSHEPEVPPALEELILRLIAKSPAARPESAGAVLEELRAVGERLHAPGAAAESEAPEPEPAPAPPGFVGRTPELEQLSAALERTEAGTGSLVMVVGEPGIGKTRLLEQFAAHARGAGALVLEGRCYDGDWAPPFSPFVEAIKQHAATTSPQKLRAELGADAGVLARIVPALHERLPNIAEPPAIPAEGERYRLLEAVADTLGRLAAEQPLVLILDDLHWADKGTIAMLQQIARTSGAQRVLVLGAYRDVELDRRHPLADALAGLRREKHFERIALRGLDSAEVAELLDVIAEQDVPAPLAEAIARETEGNPFFIKEVLLHLVEEKKIFQEDGRWTSTLSIAEMGIPEGVREVIGRRLSRLSDAANRMLTAASAMTGGFSWEELQAICDEPNPALLEALEEALAAQVFVEPLSRTFDFAHALIRHTLYEELSTPRRLMLHRRIGEALERLYSGDLDAHVAELAHHFYEAGGVADLEKAIDYCDRAGEAAIAGVAYDDAVTHYQRAAELIRPQRPLDERRLALTLLRLGLARFAATVPSIETFIEAAEAARRAGDFHLVVRAVLRDPRLDRARPSNAPLWPTEHDRFISLLDDALEALAGERSTLRACALAYRAFLIDRRHVSGGKDLAEDCLLAFSEAEQLARDIADPRALAYVLYWQQFMLNADPTLNERERLVVDELIDLARIVDDHSLLRGAHMWRTFCLMKLGDPGMDEDLELFHEMSQELRTAQASWWSSVCVAMRTMMRGDLADAERLIIAAAAFGKDVAPDAPPETGDAVDIGSTFSQQFFLLRLHQGRLPEIEGLIAGAVQQFPNIPAWRAALALAQLEAGRPMDALREYKQVTGGGIRALRSTPFFVATLPLLCEAAAVLEEHRDADELFSLMLPYQHRMLDIGWRVSLGSADRYLALLAMIMHRDDEAQRHFEDALAMTTRMSARPWLARTQLDYARMLLKRGEARDNERARELLDEALATAREIGMAKVAADCELLLADA